MEFQSNPFDVCMMFYDFECLLDYFKHTKIGLV
jgi:hypothetical protein